MIEPEKINLVAEEAEDGIKRLYYKVWEHRLEDAWNHFAKAGFKPILIKGWAVAQFYPNSYERDFVDIDLMFDPAEFKEAEQFYAKEPRGILVDFHKGAKHLDELSFAELFKHSIYKRCGETDIRVPCEEDHLRILCVHWLNDGGEDKERLRDILYAVKYRSAGFDWERCLNSVSARRRRWVVCAIMLAHKYLELMIDDIPFNEKDKIIPPWVVKTVESEWQDGIRLKPLHAVLNDDKSFWEQFQKRMFLNPIQATIETGGDMDARSRLFYQIRAISKRVYPSLKRISDTYGYRWRLRKR